MIGHQLKRGDICTCSRGEIGILTQDEQKEVTYPDGTRAMAYVGIHLDGSPWSSRHPKYEGKFEEIAGRIRLQNRIYAGQIRLF